MTLIPKRYEIYIADLNPTIGGEIIKIRPVVIVSQNLMIEYLDAVDVCPLTFQLHPTWKSRIQIICADKESEIAVDQIRTISKKRLKQKLDKLTSEEAGQLRRLITEMYVNNQPHIFPFAAQHMYEWRLYLILRYLITCHDYMMRIYRAR